jgi:probable F420-dependent oxidoreductase
MPRKFRFGVSSPGAPREPWLDLARKAEALGFATLIAFDHFNKQLSPMPALVAAAGVTSTLRLGTIVLDNDFRHPAALAKEAATLDVLAEGRFELGVGAGWREADYEMTGIPFGSPGQRLAKLRETVEILRAFFGEAEQVSFSGQHYRVTALDAFPKPVQPRLPIMIGGRQRRMLSFAACAADIVGISLLDRGDFAQKVQWVKEAAGAHFRDLELHVNARVEITDQPSQEPNQSPGTLVGSVNAIVDQLHTWREHYGVSYFVFPAALIDTVEPIVAKATDT